MISEIWDYKFDVAEIAQQLRQDVFGLEPVFQSKAFGGWSVLSSNGSYKDGWHRGFKIYEAKTEEERLQIRQEMQNAGIKRACEYVYETEICQGAIKQVIDVLSAKKLNPMRARIIQLAAQSESVWHVDAPENLYLVRFHLPIITNPHCFFETENEKQHLPADGSGYFLYVNRLHRVVNGGDSHRYHLVVDVADKTQVTSFHNVDYFHNHILGKK